MPGKSNHIFIFANCTFLKTLRSLLCKSALVNTCRYVRRQVSCSSVRASAVVPFTCSALASPRHLKAALSATSARRVSYRPLTPAHSIPTTRINSSHVCNILAFHAVLGVHTCFVCKKPDKEVRRCMIPVCGKFYHMDCIMKHSPTVAQNRGFRCSLHVCLACYITNPANPGISKGEVIDFFDVIHLFFMGLIARM